MKNLIITLFLLSITTMAMRSDNSKEVVVIEFRDFFKGDTVSVSLNQVRVVTNLILTSDPSTGNTGEKVILQNNDGKCFALYKGRKVPVNGKNQKQILVEIKMNGVSKSYKIDATLGKYIGFSKSDNNLLKMLQTAKPYIYD